jgi:hypothetical protein
MRLSKNGSISMFGFSPSSMIIGHRPRVVGTGLAAGNANAAAGGPADQSDRGAAGARVPWGAEVPR